MREPLLSREDRDLWDGWMRAARTHAKTLQHARRVDGARRMVDEALARAASWCLMWSGGKDSTILTHLVRSRMGIDLPAASEKDDLDFPGEREYIELLAAAWGLRLTILTPPLSPITWIAAHRDHLTADGDMHSRAAELSKVCFYEVVEAHGTGFDGVMLGLRKGESRGRARSRASNGTLYRKRPSDAHPAGQWVATPLGDWTGLDVYAYAETHGIELLLLYRCIAFMHRDEPWRVRKSWWLPGANARWGGVAWLRHYFPSLFDRLCDLFPDARRLA